jgi:hypothetical protein
LRVEGTPYPARSFYEDSTDVGAIGVALELVDW